MQSKPPTLTNGMVLIDPSNMTQAPNNRIPEIFQPKTARILERYRKLLEKSFQPANKVMRQDYNSANLGRSYMDEFGGTNPVSLSPYLNSFIQS